MNKRTNSYCCRTSAIIIAIIGQTDIGPDFDSKRPGGIYTWFCLLSTIIIIVFNCFRRVLPIGEAMRTLLLIYVRGCGSSVATLSWALLITNSVLVRSDVLFVHILYQVRIKPNPPFILWGRCRCASCFSCYDVYIYMQSVVVYGPRSHFTAPQHRGQTRPFVGPTFRSRWFQV